MNNSDENKLLNIINTNIEQNLILNEDRENAYKKSSYNNITQFLNNAINKEKSQKFVQSNSFNFISNNNNNESDTNNNNNNSNKNIIIKYNTINNNNNNNNNDNNNNKKKKKKII